MQCGNLEGKKAAKGSQKAQTDKSQKSLRAFFDKDDGNVGQLKRKRSEELEEIEG